jgi:hypothetical protein
MLAPAIAWAQLPQSPVHDLNELASLQGTQDAIHGYITKENETKCDLPFSLSIEGMYHRFVSVQISITKTNKLSEFSDLFLQYEGVPTPLWIPVSPIRQSATNAFYSMQLPLYVVNKGFFVLACGKDKNRNLPPRLPDVFVRILYDKRYAIRLSSYVPFMSIIPDLPPKKGEEKDLNEEDINIEIM